MAVASAALLDLNDGPSSEVLSHLKRVDSGQTSALRYMQEIAGLDRSGFISTQGDKTYGKGTLDPRFDDNTDGQSLHIGFFAVAGYIAEGSTFNRALVNAGAIYHETFDPNALQGGATNQDYVASIYGASAGAVLKQIRDRGDGDLIPSIVSGFMMPPSLIEPRPAGRTPERHDVALGYVRQLQDSRDSLVNKVVVDYNPLVNVTIAAVRGINWVRGVPNN